MHIKSNERIQYGKTLHPSRKLERLLQALALIQHAAACLQRAVKVTYLRNQKDQYVPARFERAFGKNDALRLTSLKIQQSWNIPLDLPGAG